ncbi:MAG: M50 family metallopeptidase [Oscillospiraceae bacterium]|nr:M50 family metallopeptidase [Oscillospiraceae bacterium]
MLSRDKKSSQQSGKVLMEQTRDLKGTAAELLGIKPLENKKLRYFLMIICLDLLSSSYGCLHEASHALIPLLSGWRITVFRVFPDGLVCYSAGQNVSNAMNAIFSLAGPFIPALLTLLGSLFYKYKENHIFLRELFGYFSYTVILRNMTFVMSPFFYMAGFHTAFKSTGNIDTCFDPYHFLYYTGFLPILVFLCALLFVALYIFIIWKKRIFTAMLAPFRKKYSMKTIIIFLCAVAVLGNIYSITNFLLHR